MDTVNTSEYKFITKQNNKFTVLSSYNQAIISVAQNLLKEAEIKYYIKGSGVKETVHTPVRLSCFPA